MKNFIFYFLIANFLWSTSGIGLIGHFCGGEMKFGSLYGLSEQVICHEKSKDKPETSHDHACCAMEVQHTTLTCQPQQKGCCEEEVRFLKVAQEFLLADESVRELWVEFQLSCEQPLPEFPFRPFSDVYPPELVHPPPLDASARVLFQQFLL